MKPVDAIRLTVTIGRLDQPSESFSRVGRSIVVQPGLIQTLRRNDRDITQLGFTGSQFFVFVIVEGGLFLEPFFLFIPELLLRDEFMIGLQEGALGWELILASGSPRRRDLLSEAGLSFQIESPEVEELEGGTLPPRELAVTNARLKCLAVSLAQREAMVIGADTVVALGGEVFGKPVDLEEAAGNLRKFSGRVHEVHTGVVLSCGEKRAEFVETSFVKFRELRDLDIEDYLSKVYVLDKAGGYAVQEHRELIIEKFEGDYDTIVGLPVSLVLDQLERMGFPVPTQDS